MHLRGTQEKQRPVDEFLQWLSNWHASGVSDGINPRSTPRSALRRSGVSFSAAASSSSSSSPSYSLSSDGDSGVPPSWIHAFCNQYEPSEVCIMCFCLLSGMISLPEGASRGARKEELLQKVRSVLHTYRSLPQWNEVCSPLSLSLSLSPSLFAPISLSLSVEMDLHMRLTGMRLHLPCGLVVRFHFSSGFSWR